MSNPNHPKAGDSIKVEPIRSEKDIKTLKALLSKNPRDLAIFTLGINTNLRASDLLGITISKVKDLQPGECFSLIEKKTSKRRTITINVTVYNALQALLKSLGDDVKDTDYLFQSRKGKQALSVPYLNNLVKGWCQNIHLKGNYGSHTLRKTFGFIHRTVHNTDIPTLMTMFNHSTQKQTLTYLGIQESDVQSAYLKEI